jgi:NADPH:quinone reductase-like Zn-dependent oxidoreductase
MRVVRLRAQGDLENLKLVEEDRANPRPGELLVRIRAASWQGVPRTLRSAVIRKFRHPIMLHCSKL